MAPWSDSSRIATRQDDIGRSTRTVRPSLRLLPDSCPHGQARKCASRNRRRWNSSRLP